MSSKFTSTLKPMSVGNAVSIALVLYRSHFKQYITLSSRAALWIFVPVFGWAKACMIYGQISRLAFCELVNRPETPTQAYNHIRSKLWGFLGSGMLVGLIFLGVATALVVLGAILVVLGAIFFALLAGVISENSNGILKILFILLGLALVLASIGVLIWLGSRLWLYEVTLAAEGSTNASNSIGRSWAITKGNTLRVIGIMVVAGLLTIPINTIANLPFTIALLSSPSLQSEPIATVESVSSSYQLINSALGLLVSIITMPLWQAMKAVMYCDLRVRREGLDFQLRGSEP